MQTTGTFDIVIQMPESTGSQNSAGTPAQPMQENEPVKKDPVRGGDGSGGGSGATSALIHLGMDAGKQTISAAISNIGLATGNYYMQKKVERGVTIAAKAVGYVGAIAAQQYWLVAGMLVSDAISIATENYQIQKEREIADYQASQYARKIGYTNARR
jgi:hypothetical protein